MTEILLIKDPNPYFSYLDEEHFFKWLASITAVKGVVGTRHGLEVQIEVPLPKESIYDLLALFRRYSIGKGNLNDFIAEEDQDWFKELWGNIL
jgi:hypothetical protein